MPPNGTTRTRQRLSRKEVRNVNFRQSAPKLEPSMKSWAGSTSRVRISSLFHLLFFSGIVSAFGETWKTRLPDPVTSFGACRIGEFLYVYGGHVGKAHVYSRETHSLNFGRIDFVKKSRWESLPFRKPLQGFGMTAHDDKIYLVGGSRATNKAGEKSNLSSVDEVAVFETKEKSWSLLTPLPKPRSSHELVAHAGKLYVVGGWNMRHGRGVEWHRHGLVADLSETPVKWRALPQTEWAVRANAATIAKDQLYVIGGLDDNGTTNAVRKLDLGAMKWSELPPYPAKGHLRSFGAAACSIGEKLLVSSFSFQPRILSGANGNWLPASRKLETRRFFHRIVPIGEQKAVFLGGANYDGHLDQIETLDLGEKKSKADPNPPPVPLRHKSKGKGTSWPGFRGNGNSRSLANDLPLEWSDEKNVAWRIRPEGYGQSTPVVWEDKVFSTSTIGDWSEKLLVHCHGLLDGKLLWKHSVSSPVKIRRSKMVSQAAPSPVVDDNALYLFYESGVLLALSHEGKQLWTRSLTKDYGPMLGNHGIGSSLFQSKKRLGLLVDHSGPSYLLRIDKSTGRTDWKVDRPKRVSWSTPTLASDGNEETLYLSSNGIAEAYDFASGKQIWRLDELEGNTVASPTVTEKYVIVGSSAPDHTLAIRREKKLKAPNRIAWRAEDGSSSFGSPLATDEHLYLVNRAGVATCHEIKTGKKLWNLRLPGSCWASPLSAEKRIYFFTKEGTAIVLPADGTSKILAENKLNIEGRIYGVAAVNNAFVIRTGLELIRVGS